jgi:hypothetical protein
MVVPAVIPGRAFRVQRWRIGLDSSRHRHHAVRGTGRGRRKVPGRWEELAMLAAWGTEIVLITLRDLNVNLPGVTWKGTGNRVPPGIPAPGDYLATFIIMAPLAFLADTSGGHEIAEEVTTDRRVGDQLKRRPAAFKPPWGF